MKYKIQVTPLAQSSIEENFLFYKNKVSKSIAKKFSIEISNSYKALSINPFYQFRVNQYRGYPLKKFPFILFFEINEDLKEVKIVAIFNTNRNSTNYPT